MVYALALKYCLYSDFRAKAAFRHFRVVQAAVLPEVVLGFSVLSFG